MKEPSGDTSLSIPTSPSPHPYSTAPWPAAGKGPSNAAVPNTGNCPQTDKAPSTIRLSETIVTPFGAIGDALVTAKPPPWVGLYPGKPCDILPHATLSGAIAPIIPL